MDEFGKIVNQNNQSLDAALMTKAENCPVCGKKSKELLQMPTMNPWSRDIIALNECLYCRHWWHNPLPDQKYLFQLYEGDSEFVVMPRSLPKFYKVPESVLKKFADPILKDFSQDKDFNYLEIGSGSGHILEYFSRFAKLAWGVEPSRAKNLPNLVPDIDSLPENIKFDCVVAQDVLEHISDPIDMLKKIRSRTNTGALIYAGFPNKDCYKARMMKEKWSMVRPVGHLHYFSSKSIGFMFEKAGWKVLKKRSVRISDVSALGIIREFDYSMKNLPYRLIKSLLLGQLILGKDQWKVTAVAV